MSKSILAVAEIAIIDLKVRYKRSVLGPFWMVFGTLLSVVGLAVIWGTLFNKELSIFVPELAVGLVIWMLISNLLSEAPGLFERNTSIIKNIKKSIYFYPSMLLMRHLLNFLHNLIIIILVCLYFEKSVSFEGGVIFSIYILLLLIFLWSLGVILSIAGGRYKDIEFLVQSLIPILFFLTPVLFRSEALGDFEFLIWINPFSYFLDGARSALLDYRFDWVKLGLTALITSIFLFGCILVARKVKYRFVFWI